MSCRVGIRGQCSCSVIIRSQRFAPAVAKASILETIHCLWRNWQRCFVTSYQVITAIRVCYDSCSSILVICNIWRTSMVSHCREINSSVKQAAALACLKLKSSVFGVCPVRSASSGTETSCNEERVLELKVVVLTRLKHVVPPHLAKTASVSDKVVTIVGCDLYGFRWTN